MEWLCMMVVAVMFGMLWPDNGRIEDAPQPSELKQCVAGGTEPHLAEDGGSSTA